VGPTIFRSPLNPGNSNKPEWAIVKEHIWKLAQVRLTPNQGKIKDKRLQSGGRTVYMLSGVLRCGKCNAHFVMDSATHYRCGSVVDGKACDNELRVRTDVAERVILGPVTERLLAPAMVDDMVNEMRTYFAAKLAERQASKAKRPAEVLELDSRIARLRERLKAGDADLAPDELVAVIEKAEAKRAALLANEPETEQVDKLLNALPAAVKQYRDQIAKGLAGNSEEAGRARVVVRKVLGDGVRLLPAKGGGHLVAHLNLHRAALLPPLALAAGSVGSGGRI
jgi:site-specific DNA recombinase